MTVKIKALDEFCRKFEQKICFERDGVHGLKLWFSDDVHEEVKK